MTSDVEILPKLQRAQGRVEVGFICEKNVNRLSHLHQSGCLKALIPKNYSSVPDVVLINTSGGVTGGDKLCIQAVLGHHAQVRLTTQTAERIYKASHDFGKITVELDLNKNSFKQ